MNFSNKKSIKFVPLNGNEPAGSADDFYYDELDNSPLFKGEFGECLRDAVNNYIRRQIHNTIILYKSMPSEELDAWLGRDVYKKSFRELGRELGRDKKTVQSRYNNAKYRLRHSPLMNVTFERKRRDD
jgi:hypothetical protein